VVEFRFVFAIVVFVVGSRILFDGISFEGVKGSEGEDVLGLFRLDRGCSGMENHHK
jgi:hypothetical protein